MASSVSVVERHSRAATPYADKSWKHLRTKPPEKIDSHSDYWLATVGGWTRILIDDEVDRREVYASRIRPRSSACPY